MEVNAGGRQQHDGALLSTGVAGLDDVLGGGLKADAVAPVELPGAVLIVDDNRDAADSLADLLKPVDVGQLLALLTAEPWARPALPISGYRLRCNTLVKPHGMARHALCPALAA